MLIDIGMSFMQAAFADGAVPGRRGWQRIRNLRNFRVIRAINGKCNDMCWYLLQNSGTSVMTSSAFFSWYFVLSHLFQTKRRRSHPKRRLWPRWPRPCPPRPRRSRTRPPWRRRSDWERPLRRHRHRTQRTEERNFESVGTWYFEPF